MPWSVTASAGVAHLIQTLPMQQQTDSRLAPSGATFRKSGALGAAFYSYWRFI